MDYLQEDPNVQKEHILPTFATVYTWGALNDKYRIYDETVCTIHELSLDITSADGGDVNAVTASFTDNSKKVKFEAKDSSQVGKTFTIKVYAKAGDPESTSDPYTIIRKITTTTTPVVVTPLIDNTASSCLVQLLKPMAFLSKLPIEWFE
jgi:hypothetical protein